MKHGGTALKLEQAFRGTRTLEKVAASSLNPDTMARDYCAVLAIMDIANERSTVSSILWQRQFLTDSSSH